MDAQTPLEGPAPTLQHQVSSNSVQPLNQSSTSLNHHDVQDKNDDYDPCQNAQKFSPFYQYNHDSPRPSADLRPKHSIHVSVRDLELGTITPSVTQEKMAAHHKPQRFTFERLKFWDRRQECLTKPKKQLWLQRLPKKQRIIVKLVIALVVVGAMVGIAVGIAAALHSGVYGTDDVVGEKPN